MDQFPEEPLHLSGNDGPGYFPAYPGLKLCNDRYEICRKLRWGPRNSVWMVKDIRDPAHYYALAILTAQESHEGVDRDPGSMSFRIKDSFWAESLCTTGVQRHHCFVSSLQGDTLENFRLTSPTTLLPTYVVIKIVACIVEDLTRLHKAGIVYGEITTDTVVFWSPSQTNSLDSILQENHSPPCTIEQWVTLAEHKFPIVRSRPIPLGYRWDDPIEDFYRCDLELDNFGYIHTTTAPTWERLKISKANRPPEALLGLPCTVKADVWQIGCLAFSLLIGEPFVPEPFTNDDEAMLAWLVRMCGPVPRYMAAKSTTFKVEAALVDENAVSKDDLATPGWLVDMFAPTPEEMVQVQSTTEATLLDNENGSLQETAFLEKRIREKGIIPEAELPGVLWFLRGCFCMDPQERVSVDELQDSKWLELAYW